MTLVRLIYASRFTDEIGMVVGCFEHHVLPVGVPDREEKRIGVFLRPEDGRYG